MDFLFHINGDMSARIMSTLEEMAPELTIYSIDEAFLKVTGIDACESFQAFGQRVRAIVRQRTGLTSGIGIAQTLTLTKLANHAAKTWPATGGVVDLSNCDRQRKLMALLPVNETWGIGRKLSEKLTTMGIKKVLQLTDANLNLMKKTFGVEVERTVRELNGISCVSIDALPAKQQIICSRSFGERITQLQDMRQAVCQYAEKLRQERQYCKHVSVFCEPVPTPTSHSTETTPIRR